MHFTDGSWWSTYEWPVTDRPIGLCSVADEACESPARLFSRMEHRTDDTRVQQIPPSLVPVVATEAEPREFCSRSLLHHHGLS